MIASTIKHCSAATMTSAGSIFVMTNNPTIDGVSRELRVLLERIVQGGNILDSSEAMYELRALLDSPVVERQHDCCANCMRPRMEHCGENCPAPNTSVWHAWGYDFAPGTEATPEVAALQSTIAQLEDKLTKALNLDFQRRQEIERLQARVAELESGRGEPVAVVQFALQPFRDLPYGAKFRYQGSEEVWVRTQHNVIAEWKDKLTRHDRQSLCCFCHLEGDEDGNTLDTLVEVIEDCLDATAALNTIHVGELDPAQRLALARGESFVCDISADWDTGWTFIDANRTSQGQGVCYAFPPGLTITGKWV